MARFQLWRAEERKYYWHLRAKNGEIVAQGEGYNTKDGCEKGIRFVKANAPTAPVDDLDE